MDLGVYIDKVLNWIITEGVKIPIAIVITYIGWNIINKLVGKAMCICKKRNIDSTLCVFLESIIDITLKVVLLITVLTNIWDATTASLTALVASAGLAIGLALQGSLSNLAGGVIILFFRPFRIDDFIETPNYSGTVEAIKIFYTHLVTVDNKVVTIPNGILANGCIINYSIKDKRRVDLVFSVSYDSDILMTKQLLLAILNENELVLKYPDPFVSIMKHNSSSIDFTLRAWCKNDDYWELYYSLLEKVKLEFDEKGIEIPYNKIDVSIKS